MDSIEDILELLDAQSHRQFIKTHNALDGIPCFETSNYICVGRDPRDAFTCLKHHMEIMLPGVFAKCKQNSTHHLPPSRPSLSDPYDWFSSWISSSGST
jgi:hypothetical protein